MRQHKNRRGTAIVLCMVFVLAFSALAFGGIATSPLGLKPLAGLGSCPLGSVTMTK